MRLHPKRWSLATKWSLMLTALAIGPLLAVISYNSRAASAQLLQQSLTSLQQGAQDGAASLDDALSERMRQARFLGSLASVREMAAASPAGRLTAQVNVVSDLKGLAPAYPYLQSVDLLDGQGVIMYSTAGHKGVEKDPAMITATGSGQVYVGGVQQPAGRTEPALVIAVSAGNQAILRTETSPNFLLRQGERPGTMVGLLLDSEGKVIASSGDMAPGTQMATAEDGRLTLGGGVYYAQSASLSALPWKYVVAVPEAELAKELNAQKGQGLLLALGVSLIIGALARLLALGFTRPLAAMAAATRALAEGDLTHEVKPTPRQDEVGQLQNAFAEAYGQLRKLAARMRLSSILVAEAAGHMHTMTAENDPGRYPLATASEKLSVVAKDLDRQVAHFRI